MEIFKVAVAIDGRNIEVILKAGVLATVETGSHANKVEVPESKVSVIVGKGKQGLAAWIQVGVFDASRTLQITHEGWILEGTSLSRIPNPTTQMLKCQDDADFGTLACCTSYGSGCYVRCCNSCCSDPTRCPGASCCS